MDFDRYVHLAKDTTWFKYLWEYADHIGIQIVMRSDFRLRPVREGDDC